MKNWYSNSSGHVKIRNQLSEPLSIKRRVKKGSILFTTLVMDLIRRKCYGFSVNQMFPGAEINADELTIAESKEEVSNQA